MRVLDWYKSWFCREGTLEPVAYLKHVAAGLGFFFGFFALAATVGGLGLWAMIALDAPAWTGWLLVAVYMPLGLLAIVSGPAFSSRRP
jgi:hypothetical protein